MSQRISLMLYKIYAEAILYSLSAVLASVKVKKEANLKRPEWICLES